MKILWFTNTPCSAAEKLGLNINMGGWLSSLERELRNVPEIQLAVCFYHNKPVLSFTYEQVQYFPICRKQKKIKLGRLIDKFMYHRSMGKKDQNELKKLLDVVKTLQPDIIHIHGTEDNFGLIQNFTKIPVVISIQGLLNPYADKYFSGIPRYIANKYEGVKSKILFSHNEHNFKLFKQKAERERRILKDAKYIIGRTDWDKNITRLLAPDSQYFVGNEILRNSFCTSQWKKSNFDNPIQILTISSDNLYKGFETIVATASLLSKFTNMQFVWKVAGLSTQSTIVKIAKRWQKSDLSKLHIELLGNQNEQQLSKLLLTSDLYCQVSHIENSPNSLCEAMMIGIPIVATNAGGSVTLLQDKKEGMIVQDGDYHAMAAALLKMSTDFEMAIYYAKNSRKTALERHNKEDITENLINTYKEIIDVNKK